MVATTDLYTDLGSRNCISALVNTFDPKISPGASAGSKLIAGGTYASTLLMACRRTAFPLNEVPITPMVRACLTPTVDRPTLGTVDGKLVTRPSPTEFVCRNAASPLRHPGPRSQRHSDAYAGFMGLRLRRGRGV